MTDIEKIKDHLDKHGSITSFEAFQLFGMTRLSARIYDLRRSGYPIESERKTVKTKDGGTASICVYMKSSTT